MTSKVSAPPVRSLHVVHNFDCCFCPFVAVTTSTRVQQPTGSTHMAIVNRPPDQLRSGKARYFPCVAFTPPGLLLPSRAGITIMLLLNAPRWPCLTETTNMSTYEFMYESFERLHDGFAATIRGRRYFVIAELLFHNVDGPEGQEASGVIRNLHCWWCHGD